MKQGKKHPRLKPPPLWHCPRCGAKLVTRDMWHSCGNYTIKDLFARSEPNVIRIFRTLAAMVRECGPVTIIPQKTRVVFQVRVRFLGCTPRRSYLLCNPRVHSQKAALQVPEGHDVCQALART